MCTLFFTFIELMELPPVIPVDQYAPTLKECLLSVLSIGVNHDCCDCGNKE